MTVPGPAPGPGRFGDLRVRVAAATTLAVVAALALWAGGAIAAAFVAILILAMLWESHRMVTGDPSVVAPALLGLGAAALVAVLLTALSGPGMALVALAAGGWLAALLAPVGAAWLAAGAVYLGGALCLLLAVRLTGGTLVVLWLVLVVAAGDVGAYFAGRSLGGPKLWRAVSPGKTWSGALGGLLTAAVIGLLVATVAGWDLARVLLASLVLAVASQAGDLLESAVKRRFRVKDASGLIPGHGGVMDRLDGIAGAAWAYGLLLLAGGGVHGA